MGRLAARPQGAASCAMTMSARPTVPCNYSLSRVAIKIASYIKATISLYVLKGNGSPTDACDSYKYTASAVRDSPYYLPPPFGRLARRQVMCFLLCFGRLRRPKYTLELAI